MAQNCKELRASLSSCRRPPLSVGIASGALARPPGDAPYMCGDSSQMMAGDSKQGQRWLLQPSLRRSDEDDALHQGRLEEHKSSKERGNRARASKVGGLKELAATSLAACHGWMPCRPDLGGKSTQYPDAVKPTNSTPWIEIL
uniref:Uncharacterized protein n=1 Tax=Oryza glumipatula TaxID=40148 RepID=A0A0E0ALZ1_9ORYZ